MDLHVTFRGLCLFVPDPGGKSMHVLLPASEGSGHSRHHTPTLHFRGRPHTLTNRVLDLSSAKGSGSTLELGEHVFHVGELDGRKVDAEQWSLEPRRSVAARITLPLASSIVTGETYRFQVETSGGPKPRYLTHHVSWLVRDFDIDPKWWALNPLPASHGGKPDPLHRRTGKVARVTIVHLSEHPAPNPHEGDKAPHVELYYDIFDPPGEPSAPVLDEDPNELPDEARLSSGQGGGRGGTPFNCMAGTADPVP